MIEVTDFDTSTPVAHRIELYISNRIDCYNVSLDGKLWKKRIGWRTALKELRKALLRFRSDIVNASALAELRRPDSI